MADASWKDPAAYAQLDHADLAALAWEFLRRSASYRTAYAEAGGRGPAQPFGLSVFADPDRPADEQPIFWRPDCDPRTLTVAPATAATSTAARFDPEAWGGQLDVRLTDDGACYRLRFGAEEYRFQAAAPLHSGQTLIVIEPLDAWLSIRAQTAQRLFQRLARPTPEPRSRLASPLVRRSLVLLRALDARAGGASQRAIAGPLLGFRPQGPKAWEDSAERKQIARLLRSAAAIAASGYRNLLRRARDV